MPKPSWFRQAHDEERLLQIAKNEYLKKHKPSTYAATHPAYAGTSLQARHGGDSDAVR